MPTVAIRSAAADAQSHAANPAHLHDHIHSAVVAATEATLVAAAFDVRDACATTAFVAHASAESALVVAAHQSVWENIRHDCSKIVIGGNLLQTPLWRDQNPLAYLWTVLRPKFQSADNWQPGDWQFWVDWYEQMLDPVSNPPNWELLEQVALIDPDIWNAGPEAVSEAISAIQLGFAERALATGERFEFDEGRKLFVRNPVSAEDEVTLKYCVDRLSELSDLAETMGNMQGILGGELFFVRRAVENHAVNPVMVWDNCGNAMRMLNANLASGACPEGEPYVTILQATLTDVRLRLERDPAVQHVAPHRPEAAPIEDEKAVEVLTGALNEAAGMVEPEVAEEIAQDRATLLDRFAGVGRRTAAFITGAARILAIVVAAIPGKFLGVMDYGVAFTERLQKLSENCGKIAKDIRTVTVSGALGTGIVTTATSPEKIPQAIDMVVKYFGG
ncbi:hypothetical protein GG681_00130 [Epibacterium sp. SM1969]|uniref:Uncharacterized protein n=1 Tax=Tritonibacter aquimaris TaxID=2663379 RepID=A0A844AUZ7_9RHOB|nr:hypothetical protein [Tritonibacter aquimaris]